MIGLLQDMFSFHMCSSSETYLLPVCKSEAGVVPGELRLHYNTLSFVKLIRRILGVSVASLPVPVMSR